MRWNPFRRAPSDESAAESQFESTVVDEAGQLASAAGSAATATAAATPAPKDDRPAPPPAPGHLAEGTSIGHIGRYALKTILGEGGLGTVYAAWDPLLSRTVAVKTLHLDADPASRDSLDLLFLNEARAAAGLSHPHIVTVFDAGPAENGVYIAMEKLNGQDLRQMLQQGTRPSPLEAAQLVRRVADALAYAHRKGVIHCDVKPANIFMVGRTHPKVLDFGIARIAHRETPALDGVIAGSPYYLAPEQLDGGSVDRRSDVYSLGVVLYELLCGRKPFEGRTLEDIAQQVRTADVEPAHRVAPKVPIGLSVIAGRAMARRPDQRYPSARHLSMELRHWIESAEARALLNSGNGSTSSKGKSSSSSSRNRSGIPTWQRRAVIGGSVVAAGLLGLVVWLRSASPGDEALQAAAAAASRPVLPRASAPVAVAAAASVAASAPDIVTETAEPVPTPSSAAVAAAASAAEARALARAEAKRKKAASAALAPVDVQPTAAAALPGIVSLAINPWGQVEVDGQPVGTSPPLARLTLAAGAHTVTVRNADFPAYTTTLTVDAEHPVTLRHRFGQ